MVGFIRWDTFNDSECLSLASGASEEGILGGCTLFQGINRIGVKVLRDEGWICGNKGQPEGFSLNYINSCLQFVSGWELFQDESFEGSGVVWSCGRMDSDCC